MKINRRNWLRSATSVAASGLLIPPVFEIGKARPEYSPSGPVLLNSNENAWGPSGSVIEAISRSVRESNRYPWQTRQILIDRISQHEGIPSSHILLGAGSTELLQLAGLAFGAFGGTVVSSYPTFPLMMQHAEGFNATWVKVKLDAAFHHDYQLLSQASQGAGLIYISNPNNPVGTMTSGSQLLDFCRSIPSSTVIFIDEAYMEYTDGGLNHSLAKEVLSLPNLIVARTFSKIYGMAGLRVGYVFANPDLIAKMRHYHIGFEINMPITSLHAAIAALDDQTFVKECKEKNKKGRERVYSAFNEWQVSFVPSETNFIYFETTRFKEGLVDGLEQNQVLIRDYGDQPGYARVSIGTEEQMGAFLAKAKLFLA